MSNRLARETSPYLRQHSENPVDWYPWGEEALSRAREEDKPILLSVGYSACHWCHVMAHESFEDPEIARLMNASFINIKLDREERPDLDQLYQGVVQLMGRGGGWPLTVFLTPDLRPFFGGTYFPAVDRFGMPGFPKLLDALAATWKRERPKVEQQAEAFREGLTHLGSYGLDATPSAWSEAEIVKAAQALGENVDPVHGGFGGAPKFPNPMNLALMLRGFRRGAGTPVWDAVALTLERMAKGGIYDQLGGGFHRYSTDERWLVPHFEKMLYDNAQLIHLYAEAQQIRPRPLWKQVVEETVAYVQREMTSPEGGFYAAQDADSEGEEGKFFVWTPKEIDAVLPPEQGEWIKLQFNVTDEGNFEDGRTVLELKKETEEVARRVGKPVDEVSRQLQAARRTLFEVRAKRIAPGRDDKILAGWNGLMIRGLAFASRVFDRPDWLQLATRAADFVLERMWNDGRLLRSAGTSIAGFIEDYGDVAAGLVALYEASFQAKYLDAAWEIAHRAVELFWDDARQAYLAAPKGQADLLCPTYALHDNAYPSGASTLTEAQIALAALTERPEPLAQAERYLNKLRDEAARNPFAFGHLFLAADDLLDGAAELTLVGAREPLRPFLDVLRHTYAPTLAVAARVPGEPAAREMAVALEARGPVDGKPAAYLCRHFACEAPITDAAQLSQRLERSRP